MKALQLPMGDVRQKVMIEARKRIRDVFGAELNASATDGKYDKWLLFLSKKWLKKFLLCNDTYYILGAYHASQCFVSIIKTPEQVKLENQLKSQREEKSKANPSETFLHILLNVRNIAISKKISKFIFQGLFSQQWNPSENRNWQNGRSIWHFWPKSQSSFQRP